MSYGDLHAETVKQRSPVKPPADDLINFISSIFKLTIPDLNNR